MRGNHQTTGAPFNGRLLKRRLAGGFEFRRDLHASNFGAAIHCHGVPFVNCLLTGTVVERIQHVGVHEYRRRELVFHPSDEFHSCRVGPVDSVSFGFVIPEDQMQLLRDLKGFCEAPIVLRGPRFEEYTGRMLAEFDTDDEASSLALQSLAFELAGEIARFGRFRRDLRPQPWLEKARSILHEDLTADLSLSDIAYRVGIHPVHLAQEFRRFYGMTMGAYLRKLRVDNARLRLLDPLRSIANIALETGFYDQAHFSKVFKAHIGLTPAQFRRLAAA